VVDACVLEQCYEALILRLELGGLEPRITKGILESSDGILETGN
jgi:hypothetical protein